MPQLPAESNSSVPKTHREPPEALIAAYGAEWAAWYLLTPQERWIAAEGIYGLYTELATAPRRTASDK